MLLLTAGFLAVLGRWTGRWGVEGPPLCRRVTAAAQRRPGVEAVAKRRPPVRLTQPNAVDRQIERVTLLHVDVQSKVSDVVEHAGIGVCASADKLIQFRIVVGGLSGVGRVSTVGGSVHASLLPQLSVGPRTAVRVRRTTEASTKQRRPTHVKDVRQRVVVATQITEKLVVVGLIVNRAVSAGGRGGRRRSRQLSVVNRRSTTDFFRRLTASSRRRRRSLAEEVTFNDRLELWVDCPVAALARVCFLTLYAVKTLVQRQIVTNGVLQHPTHIYSNDNAVSPSVSSHLYTTQPILQSYWSRLSFCFKHYTNISHRDGLLNPTHRTDFANMLTACSRDFFFCESSCKCEFLFAAFPYSRFASPSVVSTNQFNK